MSKDEIQELRDTNIRHSEQIAAMRRELGELRAEVKDARAGVRTLVLVLVGFAFTVAGSAVALALTLGGPS